MDPRCFCKTSKTEVTVTAQTVKPVRKKVIIQDSYNNQLFTFALTQDQIDLVKTFIENGIIGDIDWKVINEEDWEEI